VTLWMWHVELFMLNLFPCTSDRLIFLHSPRNSEDFFFISELHCCYSSFYLFWLLFELWIWIAWENDCKSWIHTFSKWMILLRYILRKHFIQLLFLLQGVWRRKIIVFTLSFSISEFRRRHSLQNIEQKEKDKTFLKFRIQHLNLNYANNYVISSRKLFELCGMSS
jgi:hypothetical protein